MNSLQSPDVSQAQDDDPSPKPDQASAQAPGSEAGVSQASDTGFSFIAWVKGLFGKSGQDIRQSLDDMVSADQVNSSTKDLSEDERTMIRNILQYHELRVDDVMVPRADIIAFDECEGFDALVGVFMDAAHSRIPVYTETLDQVLGMVHIKDIVRPLTPKANGDARKTPSVTGLLRSVLYVPPSMRVIDLLARMRAARVHMAIVVDEYGGTDGLITIEDLVEQIVGDIEDEHDFDAPDAVTDLGDGVWLADARLPIEQLEHMVALQVRGEEAEHDVDTLGGLVVSLAGAVPAIGEHIDHSAGLTFEVIDGDPRRIKQVRISKHSVPPPPPAP